MPLVPSKLIERKLTIFLKQYRAKHGIESVQVKKDGALHPLKAARAWTKYINLK